jgi:hypothetical protein
MNRFQLKEELDKLQIPQYAYSLYGGVEINKTILEEGGKWRIYTIDERGNDDEIGLFGTEEEACDFFYGEMLKWKKNDDFYKNYKEILSPIGEKRIFKVGANGYSIIESED